MKLGLYRHFKGEHYLVIGTADDANAEDLADYQEMMQRVYAHNRGDTGVPDKPTPLGQRTTVVYVPLYVVPDSETNMAVRTVEDFERKLCGVTWEEDSGERCWSCFKPLDAQDRCPDHGHTNYQVRRFEYVGGDQ